MSNEAKMTLEERIVQTLKDDHLMKLVGDEDAITDLVQRAIKEALYQPQRVNTGTYRGYEKKDSIAVEAARDAAKKAAAECAEEMVKSLFEDTTFRDQVRQALIAAIPHVMMSAITSGLTWQAEQAARSAIDRISANIV